MRAMTDPPSDPGAYRFCHRLRVRFAETDAMGIVHHAAYLPYLEEARVEYLRAEGHPFDQLRGEGYELPVVQAAVRYMVPLRFDEEVTVHLLVTRAAGALFEIAYLLAVAGEVRAEAVTLHAVVGPEGRTLRCPPWIVELAAGRGGG